MSHEKVQFESRQPGPVDEAIAYEQAHLVQAALGRIEALEGSRPSLFQRFRTAKVADIDEKIAAEQLETADRLDDIQDVIEANRRQNQIISLFLGSALSQYRAGHPLYRELGEAEVMDKERIVQAASSTCRKVESGKVLELIQLFSSSQPTPQPSGPTILHAIRELGLYYPLAKDKQLQGQDQGAQAGSTNTTRQIRVMPLGLSRPLYMTVNYSEHQSDINVSMVVSRWM
ncbi:MAG TPA: hypothetical protein VK712_01070 [Verrucomicrobiae bacterium]|nr:hypothetical protein [Verrucomicrobiae bacterium]